MPNGEWTLHPTKRGVTLSLYELKNSEWRILNERDWETELELKVNNKIWNLISVLVIITPKETSSNLPPPPPSLFLLLLLLHLLFHDRPLSLPPLPPSKTRYKQKRNETLENITHFIHLSLKNTILGVLHNISENNKLYM